MKLHRKTKVAHSNSKHTLLRSVSIGFGAALGVAAAGAGVFLAVYWPKASFSKPSTALAQFSLSGISQKVTQSSVTVDGKAIKYTITNGKITPTQKLPEGASAHVTITVERPSWIGWLVGRTKTISDSVITPQAKLLNSVAFDSSKRPLLAYFSSPVTLASIVGPNGTHIVNLATRSTEVPLLSTIGQSLAGTLTVAASPEPWEALPTPTQLTYFRSSSNSPVAVISPSPSSLTPSSTLTITLSKPVSQVFGSRVPTITPAINGALIPQGKWTKTTPYTLTYTPSQADFWPSEQFSLKFPAAISIAQPSGSVSPASASLTLQGAAPSITRLQQFLAKLNYLPLSYQGAAGTTTSSPTMAALSSSILAAPNGLFNWKWSMPSNFTSLWQSGTYNVITRGAVMSFEQFNHLDTTGLQNPLLWPTLLQDVISNKVDPHRYSWIEIEKRRPEMLYLYENGSVVFSGLTNTGIPGLNTTNGTYPIYLRFVQDYMSGTNPNGTTYHDLVHWINYFLGSEAVHGFVRSQYGFPQSLGCVELPVNSAAIVYPQVHIGTLVTVVPQ